MGWTREDWLKYRKADQEVALSYKECRLCGSYLDRCLEGLLYYNWSDTCNPAPHALKYREEQYEHAGLSWDKYRRTLSDELQKTLGEICGRCLNMFTGRSGSYVNLTICYCTLWNFNKFVADILVESAARKKKGFIPFSHCAAGCYHPNIAITIF